MSTCLLKLHCCLCSLFQCMTVTTYILQFISVCIMWPASRGKVKLFISSYVLCFHSILNWILYQKYCLHTFQVSNATRYFCQHHRSYYRGALLSTITDYPIASVYSQWCSWNYPVNNNHLIPCLTPQTLYFIMSVWHTATFIFND